MQLRRYSDKSCKKQFFTVQATLDACNIYYNVALCTVPFRISDPLPMYDHLYDSNCEEEAKCASPPFQAQHPGPTEHLSPTILYEPPSKLTTLSSHKCKHTRSMSLSVSPNESICFVNHPVFFFKLFYCFSVFFFNVVQTQFRKNKKNETLRKFAFSKYVTKHKNQ